MTVPLVARQRDRDRRLVVALFRHPRGLLCFGPVDHSTSPNEAAWLVEGEVTGGGPWRVGDSVFTLLGCAGSDAALALEYAAWRESVDADAASRLIDAASAALGCPAQAPAGPLRARG